MNILYLKAESRAALIAALEAAGMWQTDSEGERFKGPHPGDALDEIGTIYRGTGVKVVVEGEEVEQQEFVEGYHANLMLHGDVPEGVEALRIPVPRSPRQVFAVSN